MDFALCPSHGPPRLIRFGVLDDDTMICRLDEETNVLFINRWLYDQLHPDEQDRVLKTKARALHSELKAA